MVKVSVQALKQKQANIIDSDVVQHIHSGQKALDINAKIKNTGIQRVSSTIAYAKQEATPVVEEIIEPLFEIY